MIWITLAAFPAIILSGYMIDLPDFGRTKSMMYFFLGSAIMLFIIYYFEGQYFLVLIVLTRFFNRTAICFSNAYLAEIYGTVFRTTGIAIANVWSDISGIILPIFILYFFDIDPFLPYLVLGCFSLAAAFSSSSSH